MTRHAEYGANTACIQPCSHTCADSLTASIITTCKGRLTHLRKTLPKMLAQEFPSRVEVIVVDYGCPDGTHSWCRELSADNLVSARVLRETDTFNLSRARNLGARIARGEMLAFVDADIELAPNWLEKASRRVRMGEAVVARATRFKGQSWDRCGTCVVATEVFHELCGFDEAMIGWSLADLDFYNRCRMRGGESFFDPFRLTPIRHSDDLRVQFCQSKDRASCDAQSRQYLATRVGPVNPDGYAQGPMEVSRSPLAENVDPFVESRSSIDELSTEMEQARRTVCETCTQRIGNRCRLLGPRLGEHIAKRTSRCPLGAWPSIPLGRQVTIGVTSFMRPESLARLRDSIERLYPNVPLLTIDTGGNLSWGRNQLAQQVTTPYLLLCEDDFEFSENTNIEALADVLNSDDEIGGVGGFLVESAGPMLPLFQRVWAFDFELFRDQCRMVPPRRQPRVTAGGTAYQPCELILNFGLFRLELFREIPWDEDLPLCEHRDWYWRVAQSRRWRMAICHDVGVNHHRDRPDGYSEYRNRRFHERLREKHGFQFLPPPEMPGALDSDRKPNVILFGVGHSGTSIVAKQLFQLGWNRCDADEQFAESVSIRQVNREVLATGRLDEVKAGRLLRNLPQPWAIKDPRFVEFLPRWLSVLGSLDRPPLLVWLRRDVKSLIASYEKRDERLEDGRPGVRGRPVEELVQLARRNFHAYPWHKISFDVDQIANAVELFDVSRLRTVSS